MRVDFLLDPLYVLGALWGLTPGTPVCPANPHVLPPPPAGVTAFVDVNVVPMDRERVLPNQTVVIEGHRITALGPAGTVKVPAGATRIDGRGKYLIPGLGSMHEHNLYPNRLFEYLANGVTTVRHVDETPIEVKRDAAKLPGPRPHFYVTNAVNLTQRPDSVVAQVIRYKAQGYDLVTPVGFVDSAGRVIPERRASLDSLRAVSRRLRMPLVTHYPMGFEAFLALGPTGSAEHLQDHMDALKPYRDRGEEVPDSVLRALALANQRAGVWNSPTIHCYEGRSHQGGDDDLALRRRLIKALQDAGAGLLLGYDGQDGSPLWVHIELAGYVRAGLTPYQALVTGTRNIAEYLQVPDSSGTIAVGKWADLVLLSGNPLQDIRHTREPAGVMMQGQWLDRAALDQHLLTSAFGQPNRPSGRLWELISIAELTKEQETTIEKQVIPKVEALTDSLAAAPAAERVRVLRQLAAEFAAVRTLLTSAPQEKRELFDVVMRVWLREQVRRGHQVAIAGVTLAPTP